MSYRMKLVGYFGAMAVAMALGGCVSNGQNGAADSGCDSMVEHVTLVRPIEPGIDMENIKDGTYPVAFTADSFNWMGGNLTMDVYAEVVYDSVQVQELAKGDSIIYDGRTVVVESVRNEGSYVTVNGGYCEDGLDLQSTGNGTYRATVEDDHSVYVEVGETELPLDDDFVITDCGDEPDDEGVRISSGQKLYIEGLKDYKREFSNIDTSVEVKGGMIVGIRRVWIP